jgi:hypothetical protein
MSNHDEMSICVFVEAVRVTDHVDAIQSVSSVFTGRPHRFQDEDHRMSIGDRNKWAAFWSGGAIGMLGSLSV